MNIIASGNDRGIFRYEVPVDDQLHSIELGVNSSVLAVAARKLDVIEFWSESVEGQLTELRTFIVVGTGHPLPQGDIAYCGMTMVAGGRLVWHLLELK